MLERSVGFCADDELVGSGERGLKGGSSSRGSVAGLSDGSGICPFGLEGVAASSGDRVSTEGGLDSSGVNVSGSALESGSGECPR